jgi:dienelactone hydrolase
MNVGFAKATSRLLQLGLLTMLTVACSPVASSAPLLVQAAPSSEAIEVAANRVFLGGAPLPNEDLVHLFDYDQTAALDIHEAEVVINDDFRIHDIAYESPKGGGVAAYLVTPPGEGPFAGIIFLHPGGGDRSWFLDEAKKLAKRGAISLLIDDNFSAKGQVTDHDRIIRIVVDLRRAVDLLVARPDVDPHRIGFVGHSYGANLGGVLAGVEHRIAAYVFMSGNARLSQDLIGLFNMAPQEEAQYIQFMAQLDGIHFIGHAAPAALLFQNAQHDALNSEHEALDFHQAASEPKLVKWYDAYHQLNEEAEQDRAEWLSRQLHLRTGPLPGENIGANPRFMWEVMVSVGAG